MNRCKTCIHWKRIEDRYNVEICHPRNPATFDELETDEEVVAVFGYLVRHCCHPKLVFYQRPERNAAAVVDGSEYYAALLTAEDFGCVLHEPTSSASPPPQDAT